MQYSALNREHICVSPTHNLTGRTSVKAIYLGETHRFLHMTAVGVNQANGKH